MEDKIFEKLEKIARDRLELSPKIKVTLDSDFKRDLGADSLDSYELLYAVEEEFEMSIPDSKAQEFITVRDCYNYIKSHQ